MTTQRFRRPPRRRGFGLVEMAVAGLLFGTMALLTVQLVGWVATERQAVARREAVGRALSNLMERTLTRPWAEVTTEALAPLAASAGQSRPIAPGVLRVEVVPGEAVDGRGQKRIVVEVTWPDRSGVAQSPARLVAWTYERQGVGP